MFIANDNELREFTQRILEHNYGEEVMTILREQDQKRLRYVKLSMQQRMPRQLHSSKYKTLDVLAPTSYEKESFPRMFDKADKKTYQYIDDDLQNIKQIAYNYSECTRIDKLNQSSAVQNSRVHNLEAQELAQDKNEGFQKQIEQDRPQRDAESRSAKQEKSKKSRPQSQQPSKHSQGSKTQKHPFESRSPKVNPFINNKLNFTDQYANSKALQGKYPHLAFTQSSRNITAIVQSAKFDAFSNNGCFPTSVMPGVILVPRQSSFSKEAQLDVGQVMKYSLGVGKQPQGKGKIQNPFQRRPRKKEE